MFWWQFNFSRTFFRTHKLQYFFQTTNYAQTGIICEWCPFRILWKFPPPKLYILWPFFSCKDHLIFTRISRFPGPTKKITGFPELSVLKNNNKIPELSRFFTLKVVFSSRYAGFMTVLFWIYQLKKRKSCTITVIKHYRNLRTQEKFRVEESVFYIMSLKVF